LTMAIDPLGLAHIQIVCLQIGASYELLASNQLKALDA